MNGAKENIGTGMILLVGGGLLALVLVGLLVALGMYLLASDRTSRPGEPLPTFVREGILPPAPRLQTDPHEDLRKLQAAEDSILSGYAWVNRDSALVRIPVTRALAIVARRGLPVRGGEKNGSHQRSPQ